MNDKRGRRISVRGVRRDPPDLKKLSRALIALALEQAHVGLYLSGDREASSLADQLCTLQESNASLLAKQLTSEGEKMLQDMQEASEPHHHTNTPEAWLHSALKMHSQSDEAEKALSAMKSVQDRLARLSGTTK